TALLANGLGRYDEALVAAQQASRDVPELFVSDWALVELVEAGGRTGNAAIAGEGGGRGGAGAGGGGAGRGGGGAAPPRALVGEGEQAEASYVEAIDRLGRTPLRPELARAHLVYGEWLRREARRVDARAQLHAAHELFTQVGMEAFAERARRE